MSCRRAVSIVTLGCGRNDVDSEELASRLATSGWTLVDEVAEASVIVVNTCGFIEPAKRESVDTLLAAAATGRKVVAVGCLAERYGGELAEALPEADAVLGFDAYPHIGGLLDRVLAGRPLPPHAPRDRRRLLPVTPAHRQGTGVYAPGHGGSTSGDGDSTSGHTGASVAGVPAVPPDLPDGVAPPSGPRPVRRRLGGGPVAPLKLASGCDRRCTFCAIPSFRGAFVSRPPKYLVAEAEWLAGQGVREIVLVSENSTSYGKDLGDIRLLEKLLPQLAAVRDVTRVRVSYLQPAEMRPSLVDAMTSTPGLAPYFDLSFQHASAGVLRRMRRFGGRERFLGLLDEIRERDPEAGVRTNVIVGFPGETHGDVRELERFLTEARFDAVGVFGYSDEEGTRAAHLDHKVPRGTIARRVERVTRLVEELTAQRAEERLGSHVDVIVEDDLGDGVYEGRAAHQAPEVDGSTTLRGGTLAAGDVVRAKVTGTSGVDLVADVVEVVSGA